MEFIGNRLIVCLVLALCACSILQAEPTPEGREVRSVGLSQKVILDKPVLVSLADPGEHRWGRHQFVSLSRYRDGGLLLRFHAGEDSVVAYGTGQPTFLSRNLGNSWVPFTEKGLPEAGLVCAFGQGEMLCMPMPKPLKVNLQEEALPEPVGQFFSYRKMLIYPAEKCSKAVKDFLRTQAAWRWIPKRRAWVKDEVNLDMDGRLVWMGPGGEAGLVAGTSFERAPIRVGRELLWADYRSLYRMPDGTIPQGFGVSCMVSTDNGSSWKRRAFIAQPDTISGETNSMTEPVLAENTQGQVVCVIRRTDQQQKSMLLTFSQDQGKTWETPRALTELGNLGVMPDLVRLEGGPMILSYGRPGVYLTFSLDGTGREWATPLTLVAGDPAGKTNKTDGYTSLMAIGKNSFLVAYTDFEYPDEQGRKRKAVLVRRVELIKAEK